MNVTGQLIVTQAFAPLCAGSRAPRPVSRGRGAGPHRHDLSIAGENASPFLGPYNASKFALEGLSECLRRELMLFGIDVIVIAPGAVATPIWDKVAAIDMTRLAGTPYGAISSARNLRSSAAGEG